MRDPADFNVTRPIVKRAVERDSSALRRSNAGRRRPTEKGAGIGL
jgi:hypothetical protein